MVADGRNGKVAGELSKVCRGIRGATTIALNSREAILDATQEVLTAMVKLNGVAEADVAGVIFTTTQDLDAEFPAAAARRMGWQQAPLIGAVEMNAAHGLAKCLRVLLLWNTEKSPAEIRHVYLGEAQRLRPDRALELNEVLAALAKEVAVNG